MTAFRGWRPPAIAAALVIVALAMMLHSLIPGPAQVRANYTTHGSGSVEAGSIRLENATVVLAETVTFNGVECPEDGIFVVVRADYRYTEVGNVRRGLLLGGNWYAPSACQDDLANVAPIVGERYTMDTVFVVDRRTIREMRGRRFELHAAYLDPWYQNLSSRVIVDLWMPVMIPLAAFEAEARR